MSGGQTEHMCYPNWISGGTSRVMTRHMYSPSDLILRLPVYTCIVVEMLLAIGCHTQTGNEQHARLQSLISQEWEHRLRTRPEFATEIGDNRYNDRLRDYSADAIAREVQYDRRMLHSFRKLDTNGLSKEDQLDRILILRTVETRVERDSFKNWEMPVDQMNGPHLYYATLPENMPFNTTRDYDNYLSRLRGLPHVFSQVADNMRLGIRDHLMPPSYVLEKVAAEAEDVANKPVDQSLFTEPLKHLPNELSTLDKERITAAIEETIRKQVLPAYAAFARFVRSEYAPHGRSEFGIWSLPDGAARYRQAIHEMTTTDMDPSDLHALGLRQVTEIEAQMLAVAHKVRYPDLKSFNSHISKDRQLYGKSGEQILSLYKHYTDQMYLKLPQYFGRLPKNKLIVVPMEAYRAPHAVPADYSIGAGDGSRPGRINVNEYEPTHRLLLNVEAIAYHEGIPGHHLQFSIAQELTEVPPFRKFAQYNAYSEGWALYAETLAHEIGFYQDPYSEYGRLQNLMWRSVRLVVDTGVHSRHWSRQQMIDFFHQHTVMDNQNIETEVDRYIAWPAQALGYKLGEMTILQSRERAQKQLAGKFDIRAFHDAVLSRGPLPLNVLEMEVNQWIAEVGKAH
jgi:uncharacterized protein (DUF885 family)